MKKVLIYFNLLLLCMFINISLCCASETVCNYSFKYTLKKNGSTENLSGGKLKLKIYDDGSHNGTGIKKKDGGWFAENYGGENKTINNWGSSYNGASAIGGLGCPTYIGIIISGVSFTRQWYGFTEDTIKTEGPIIADLDNDDSMWVFKWDDWTDTNPETAVAYTCQYKGDYHFSIDFNSAGLALSAYDSQNSSTIGVFTYLLSNSMMTKPPKTPGVCEDVRLCLIKRDIGYLNGNTFYNLDYMIFSDDMDYDENKGQCLDSFLLGITHYGTDNHNGGCRTYENYISDLKLLRKDPNALNNYKKLKNKILSLCSSITKYSNYKEGNCLNSCMKAREDISDIEKTTPGSGQCGFSERLIQWIANIIRWAKYIIPVAVIVLGILDFIKAMSKDKDDEMKKAQQRFIRRLIAAALIFIAPFIIEFILNKMGFDANGCGIINL